MSALLSSGYDLLSWRFRFLAHGARGGTKQELSYPPPVLEHTELVLFS